MVLTFSFHQASNVSLGAPRWLQHMGQTHAESLPLTTQKREWAANWGALHHLLEKNDLQSLGNLRTWVQSVINAF